MIGGDWGRSVIGVGSSEGGGEGLGLFSIVGLLYLVSFIFIAIAVLAKCAGHGLTCFSRVIC